MPLDQRALTPLPGPDGVREGFGSVYLWHEGADVAARTEPSPGVFDRPCNYQGRAQAAGATPGWVIMKDRTTIVLALPTRLELAAFR